MSRASRSREGSVPNTTPSKPTLMGSAKEFYHNATDVKSDMKEQDPIVQIRNMITHGVCKQVRKWALEQINHMALKEPIKSYSFDDIFAPLAQAANVFHLPGFVNDALAQTCKRWIADQTNLSTILFPFHNAMGTWIACLNGSKDILQKQIVCKAKDVIDDLDNDNEIKVDTSQKKKDDAIDDLMKLLDKLIARLFKSINITPMIEPSTRGVSSRGSRGSATLSPPKSSSRSQPLALSPPSLVYQTPPSKDKANKGVDEESLKVTPGDGHVVTFHGKKDDDPDDDVGSGGDSAGSRSSRSLMASIFFSFLCGANVKNGDGSDKDGAGYRQSDNIVSDTRDKVLMWLAGESDSTAAPWILSDLDFVGKLVQAASVERDEAIHLFHCVHRVKGISPATPSTSLDASCLAYLLCLVCVAFARTGMVVTDMSKMVDAFNMLTFDGKAALWSERKWFRFFGATRPFDQFLWPLGLLGPDEPVETGWTTTTSTPPSASSFTSSSASASLDESMNIEGGEPDSSLEIRGRRHRRSSSAPTTPQPRKLCYGESAIDPLCNISMEGVPFAP